MIELPIKLGDTILIGKWRNKKSVIKTIDYDENGLPLINGKKIVNFKLPPPPIDITKLKDIYDNIGLI